MVTTSLNPPRPGGEPTLYDAVGGMPFFVQLVEAFYAEVSQDEPLISIYPERDDLGPAKERLWLFLAQYFGGPTTYSEQRGHPRLRMRHAPYVIDAAQRDRWLTAMGTALGQMDVAEEHATAMWNYFTMAAEAMRNAE